MPPRNHDRALQDVPGERHAHSPDGVPPWAWLALAALFVLSLRTAGRPAARETTGRGAEENVKRVKDFLGNKLHPDNLKDSDLP